VTRGSQRLVTIEPELRRLPLDAVAHRYRTWHQRLTHGGGPIPHRSNNKSNLYQAVRASRAKTGRDLSCTTVPHLASNLSPFCKTGPLAACPGLEPSAMLHSLHAYTHENSAQDGTGARNRIWSWRHAINSLVHAVRIGRIAKCRQHVA
jgi:hypothetical protein